MMATTPEDQQPSPESEGTPDCSKRPKGSLRGHLILARHVEDSLGKHKQGNSTDYFAIIDQLSVVQSQPLLMQRFLQALCVCVSRFSKEYDQLVSATLRLTWYDKDDTTVDRYLEYLTTLLSAQLQYLHTVLATLTRHLWAGPVDSGGVALSNIHKGIRAVLGLVPTAPSVLMPLISKSYPFRGKGVEVQELALRNVLYISTYCPTLRDDIFDLVIHQMLAIDVELPNLEEIEGEELSADQEDTQFHVDLEGAGNEEREGEESPVPLVLSEGDAPLSLGLRYSLKQVMSHEQANKLDVMMTISLQHFHSLCYCKGVLDVVLSCSLLNTLLKIFERVLLPTHACSNVQFLLFSLTTLHKEFPGHFLDFLWKKFQDPNTPAVLRQTTATYIASYVARSKCVSLETTRSCLIITTQWIHQYLDNSASTNVRPDIKHHGPFYALCQALFYIFSFRHKSLIEMKGGVEFLRQLNFERIITSRLNPLKVCLPSVVDTFAFLASRHEVAFSYTILERNKRLILSSSAGVPPAFHSGRVSGLDGGTASILGNHLDCFFPFDPYQLKRSGSFVHPFYQTWEEVGAELKTMEPEDGSDVSVASSPSLHGNSLSAEENSIHSAASSMSCHRNSPLSNSGSDYSLEY